MKNIIILGTAILTLVLTSCITPTPAPDAESWDGIFSTKDQGVQKISVFLSFKDSTGLFNMPDVIPFALDLYSLRKYNDSMTFKVDFRNGTVVIKGKYVHPDTIKGVSVRTNGLALPFELHRSKTSNNIYNLPKPSRMSRSK